MYSPKVYDTRQNEFNSSPIKYTIRDRMYLTLTLLLSIRYETECI